tara:strand:+ start:22241 stop:23338 length:1098 start_codon:yes stop_codon:yes gene_type:complete
MKRFKTTHFRNLGLIVLIAGLAFTSCKDSSTSAYDENDMALSAQVLGNNATTTNVFTSDGTELSWGPIEYTGSDWIADCKATPAVGLDAFTGPGSQTYAFPQFTASFAQWYTNSSWNAKWINAWNSISSTGHAGTFDKHWTKYSKTISGDAGNYVMQYVADNCSWIFINGVQTDFQGTTVLPAEVSITLPGGPAELSFIILDGGGQAGGIYRLETYDSYKERTGIDPEVKFEDDTPIVIPSSDETPPVLSYSQVTGIVWPPNHKMVLVATGITASDNVDGETEVEVTVTSNEDSNGKGDGNTDSDWEVVTNADGSKDVYVRSERSGKGNGRTYTISMSASDVAGNTTLDSFEVQVVHNKGKGRGK